MRNPTPTLFRQRHKFKLSRFVNSIFYVRHMAELHQFIEDEINGNLEGAYVCPYVDKKGRCRLNVSVGEDKAFSGWISWKDFTEMFVDGNQPSEMKKFVSLLEALIRKIKKEIKRRET